MKRSLALMILITSMLVGCGSSSSPTESEGEQALRQELISNDAPCKVVSFHKTNGTNGTKEEKDGVPSYVMEFTAELEITKDANYGFRYEGLSPVKQGQHKSISGNIEFKKTDNAWRQVVGPTVELLKKPEP
jgi:hypothetical protein